MKLKFNFRSLMFMLVMGSMISFASCNRKNNDPAGLDDNGQDQVSARDNSQSEGDVDASTDMENRAVESLGFAKPAAGEQLETVPFTPGGTCADISIVTNGNVRTATIDFGSVGCVGIDGRTRKGKIIVTFEVPAGTTIMNNPFNIVGRTVTTTFDNHFVGFDPTALVKVEGTKRVICQAFSTPTPNQPTLATMRKDSVIVTNGKFTFPDNTTHTWNSNRSRTFTANSFNWLTNQASRRLEVWGNYSGVNRNNVAYTGSAPASNKVVWKGSCLPLVTRPVAGQVTLTRTLNGVTRTALVDYGNETCDNTFTVTINGQTFTVN